MLKIKNITLGFILGISVSFFTPVFANVSEYILTRATYPIIVNNVEYTNSELPILNMRGNTYVPLKSMATMLDVEIKWNDELKRVEISEVVSEVVEDNKIINENKTIQTPAIPDNELNLYISADEIYKQVTSLNMQPIIETLRLDNEIKITFKVNLSVNGVFNNIVEITNIPIEKTGAYSSRLYIEKDFYENVILKKLSKFNI